MKSASRSQRTKAYKLAKASGLIDSKGRPTDEYNTLINQVTGKDRMAIMTHEEADRFLEALESLLKTKQSEQNPFVAARPHLIAALIAAAMLLIALAPLE